MNPVLSTSIMPGQPNFARSCVIIHDIDMGLVGDGVSIDSDACVSMAASLDAKSYRYGILDFPELPAYLESCTADQAEVSANDFSDALSSLKSAYPSVRWTLAQTLRTNPFDSGLSIASKQFKSFVSQRVNLLAFSKIVLKNCTWCCVDLRPDVDESLMSANERLLVARARANCGLMVSARSGWTSSVFGCIGKYVWDPRDSFGYVDSNFPINSIGPELQYFGISGLLHYNPASVVWRVYSDHPESYVSNGIAEFSEFYIFDDAKNALNSDCALLMEIAPGFSNPSIHDPREILLNKIVDNLSGSGEINKSEHVWHKLNRSVNVNDYWLRRDDTPPRPDPSNFS
jgi:hypothetical protein